MTEITFYSVNSHDKMSCIIGTAWGRYDFPIRHSGKISGEGVNFSFADSYKDRSDPCRILLTLAVDEGGWPV